MTPSRPPTTAEQLRAAVAAGSYGEVERLLTQYGGEVESTWRTSPEPQRRLIAREATSLLEWTRHTILAARSHAQYRQAQWRRQSAYATPRAQGAMRRGVVNLDG
jgi:hypothetical protein